MPCQVQPRDQTRLACDYIAFTSAWIETLRETTCEDPVLSTVYQLVQHGWPKERRRVPNVAKYYWDFRDELSTDEGLLLKGLSLIIPAALRENYRSGTVNSNTVNSKFHLIRSCCKYLARFLSFHV